MLRIALLATALGSTSAFVVTAPVHQRLAAARGPVASGLRMVETETKDKAGAKPADVPDECEVPPEKNMLKQIKDLGAAGAVSYALWELGFWAMSIPIGEFGFYEMGEPKAAASQFSARFAARLTPCPRISCVSSWPPAGPERPGRHGKARRRGVCFCQPGSLCCPRASRPGD